VPRQVEKYDLSPILKIYPELRTSNVEVYIDVENKKEAQKIKSFLKVEKNLRKFRRIIYEILNHRYNDSLYQKVKGFKDVAEMRFPGKFIGNARIYCKDLNKEGKTVIMISLFKKTQKGIKDDADTKSICERISKYNYDQ
jgi:hypothetical protein